MMIGKELFNILMSDLRECGEVILEEELAKEFRDYLDKIQFEYNVEWESTVFSTGHQAEMCYITIKEG